MMKMSMEIAAWNSVEASRAESGKQKVE
jgi:hypothetical protein